MRLCWGDALCMGPEVAVRYESSLEAIDALDAMMFTCHTPHAAFNENNSLQSNIPNTWLLHSGINNFLSIVHPHAIPA